MAALQVKKTGIFSFRLGGKLIRPRPTSIQGDTSPGPEGVPLMEVPLYIQIHSLNNFPTDVSIAIIDLLQEMTDVDTLNESEDGATALIDALVSFCFTYYYQLSFLQTIVEVPQIVSNPYYQSQQLINNTMDL